MITFSSIRAEDNISAAHNIRAVPWYCTAALRATSVQHTTLEQYCTASLFQFINSIFTLTMRWLFRRSDVCHMSTRELGQATGSTQVASISKTARLTPQPPGCVPP